MQGMPVFLSPEEATKAVHVQAALWRHGIGRHTPQMLDFFRTTWHPWLKEWDRLDEEGQFKLLAAKNYDLWLEALNRVVGRFENQFFPDARQAGIPSETCIFPVVQY